MRLISRPPIWMANSTRKPSKRSLECSWRAAHRFERQRQREPVVENRRTRLARRPPFWTATRTRARCGKPLDAPSLPSTILDDVASARAGGCRRGALEVRRHVHGAHRPPFWSTNLVHVTPV